MHRVIALAAALFTLSIAGRAGADASCATAVDGWAAACSKAEGLSVQPERCMPGGATFSVGFAGTSLRVEVNRSPDRSFRRVGAIGVSPIGQFPDWSREPEALQQAFDKFAKCVERGGEAVVPEGKFAPQRGSAAPTTALPWRFLAGCAAAIAAAIVAMRGKGRRALASTMLAPLLLVMFAIGFRLVMITPAFFHQNGHGAMWVSYALCGGSPYGSGFSAMFGWAARLAGATAEQGVFALQMGLAALVPACGWVLVRTAGGRPALACAAGLLLAIHPVLSRGARSESYYTACTSLLFLAASVLAAAGHRLSIKRPVFVLGVIASGFFIAQAALIHPACWIAAALTPLVLFTGPGRPRDRLRAVVSAGLGIGAVVAATALPSMLRLLTGDVGGGWLPRALMDPKDIVLAGAALLLLPVLAVVPLGRRRKVVIAAVTVLAIYLVEYANNMLRWPPGWALYWAWALMFAPPLLPAATRVVATLWPGRRHALRAAAAILVAGVAYTASQWRTLTALPTDALESITVAQWRHRIPQGAVVIYVRSAEQHIQELPFYDQCGVGPFTSIALGNDERGFRIPASAETYYYRSSVCSTPPGRPLCEDIERRHRLVSADFGRATFPAKDSMPDMSYDADHVEVELYHVLPENPAP